MPFPLIGWAAIALGAGIAGVVAANSSRSSGSSSSSREAEEQARQQAEEEREACRAERYQQQRLRFLHGQLHPLFSTFAPSASVPSDVNNDQIENFLEVDIEDFNSAKQALEMLCGCTVDIKTLPSNLDKLSQRAAALNTIKQLLQEV